MPESTPTTDSSPKKPINKTAIILLLAGGVVLVYFLHKKKKQEEEGSSSIPYSSQAFIPVTGENVAGAGASGSAPITNAGGFDSQEFATLLLGQQKENQEFIQRVLAEDREQNRSFYETLKTTLTGGGPPGSGQVGTGGGSGGGGEGPTPKTGPEHPAASCPTSKCGPSFTLYNAANGPPGPKSCYHISREKAKKPGYVIHGYCDGHEVESR